MIATGALIAIAASTVAWSGFDVLRKFLVRRVDVIALGAWVSFVQLPGFAAWALYEHAAHGVPLLPTEGGYVLPALVSVAFNVLANLLYLHAVRLSPLSVVIPLLSFTPVFAALAGVPFLGERLEPRQWAGIGLLIAGAFVLPARTADVSRPWRLVRSLIAERGALYMLVVAVLWALTPTMDKLAIRHAGVGVHATLLSLGVGVGFVLVLLVRGQTDAIRPPRELAGWLGWCGLAAVAALGLQLVAIREIAVSIMEAFKRAGGLVVSVASGRVFFDEPITAPKVLAVALMTPGVLLVLGVL